MLVQRGRFLLAMDMQSWLATVAEIEAIRFAPVGVAIATKSVDLTATFYNDAADRIIVATARKFAAPLVTKYEKIRAYAHVKTIW